MSIKSFRQFFEDHPGFEFHHGLFYQIPLSRNSDFEKEYLQIRGQEGRLYSDTIVKNLPSIPGRHPLQDEWTIRKQSADRLVRYLKKQNPQHIIEVGCGNGWLMHYIQQSLQTDCCGIDINETELKQAVRLFGNEKNTFVYADIHSSFFKEGYADVIILASVIQYFPDLRTLLDHLGKWLNPSGEIHIIDSPLYDESKAASARERSEEYFKTAGHTQMLQYYYHHTWESIKDFHCTVLYDPTSSSNRLKKLFVKQSPFPWIKVQGKL